ncbi:LapA family protein [Amycolatopsis granulosa]|uniref:LapA family protein n=1 Tax=Amycolatopsis granulosa TaxID=185684 RepID=UPI0014200936|nr:LapA family protein [Amycolatopsis granulosa]NIH86863.1 putative integral membrane protein [Amycolatopsis granulosa]
MTHAQGDKPVSGTPPQPPVTKPAPAKPVRINRTRVSGTWFAIIIALIILIFLLIFILQNLASTTVTFLGMQGSLPLAVAMLFSAIAGAVLVALVGGARIVQLRKATRKANKVVR